MYNIYLLEQEPKNIEDAWDVYRKMVVVAVSEQEAKDLSILYAKPSVQWGLCWPLNKEEIKVTLVGQSIIEESKVLITDFKHG